MKYTVQATVEVCVEADTDAQAQEKAYLEITFGTDVDVIEWGYIGAEEDG